MNARRRGRRRDMPFSERRVLTGSRIWWRSGSTADTSPSYNANWSLQWLNWTGSSWASEPIPHSSPAGSTTSASNYVFAAQDELNKHLFDEYRRELTALFDHNPLMSFDVETPQVGVDQPRNP